MKTDLYTKTVLTVIAVALSINLLTDFDIITKAYANDSTQSVVDVRIREIDPIMLGAMPVEFRGTMPVNIEQVDGMTFRGALPINISALQGSILGDALPVKVQDIEPMEKETNTNNKNKIIKYKDFVNE